MRFLYLAFLVLLLLPVVSAQTASNAAGSGHSMTRCSVRELAAIAGVIAASNIEACFNYPELARSSSSVKTLGMNVQGPDIPTGGTASFTASTVTATGCTVGTWTTVSNILVAGTGASSYADVTMTSDECRGVVEMVVTAAAVPVTLATFRYNFNIITERTAFTNTLAGGVTVTDDANGWAIHQDALTGTITVSGIPDTQQEIQAVADAIALLQDLNVNIVNDATDDDMLTVPTSAIAIDNQTINAMFPDTFEVTETTANEWVPVFLWFAVMLLLLRLRKAAAALCALLGLLNEVLPIMPGSRMGYILLFALGLWLEAVTGDRLYAKWIEGDEKPGDDKP